VINHLQEICKDEPLAVVAYWYFTFTDSEKQNVASMLCSLVRDIFSNRLDTPVKFQDAVEMANNGLQRPSTKALTELLKAVVRDFGTVYLVVDAVDECPKFDGERAKLLKLLYEVFSWRFDQLHIFVTGRREVDILDAFDEMPRQFGYLQVINAQGAQWQRDIELFLMHRLQDSKFSSWNWDMRNKVKSKLVSRARGMSVHPLHIMMMVLTAIGFDLLPYSWMLLPDVAPNHLCKPR
jgi:ankyrin repeat domain-containing protein 50